ncbi:MAG: hypothetical protein C4576_34430, partial [Desulfobacteraceae bacterium]
MEAVAKAGYPVKVSQERMTPALRYRVIDERNPHFPVIPAVFKPESILFPLLRGSRIRDFRD